MQNLVNVNNCKVHLLHLVVYQSLGWSLGPLPCNPGKNSDGDSFMYMVSLTAKKRRDEEAEKKRIEFEKMLERQLELHIKARTSQYPCTSCKQLVYSFNVPDEKVAWDVSLWGKSVGIVKLEIF